MKLKICMVGEAAVGKTSLIRRYVHDHFNSDYVATLGTKVTKRELEVEVPGTDRTERVALMIWDIMGQKKVLDLMREGYFHGAQGLLMVSDLNRPKTLEELEGWRTMMVDTTGEIPSYLLANKVDLVEKEPTTDDLDAAKKRWGCSYVLTSAKTGEGVEQAFYDLAVLILRKLRERKAKRA